MRTTTGSRSDGGPDSASDRDVAGDAPYLRDVGRVVAARLQDPPRPRRGPVDGKVALAIAVVVARDRDVAGDAPYLRDVGRVVAARLQDPPRPRRGPVDGKVALAIAVVVA